MGVAVLVATGILLWPSQHHSISQAGEAAQLHPIPGGPGSPRYEAQLAQYNREQAQQAAAYHQSELPTMGQLQKVKKRKPVTQPAHRQTEHPMPVSYGYGPNPYAAQISKEIGAIIAGDTAATESAYQVITNPGLAKVRAKASTSATTKGLTYHVPPAVLAQAGHISFATLDTAIKSTEPGPVLATIQTGRFAGARLLGGFTRVHSRVVIKFDEMDWHHQSMPITATAITLKTARTALATSVNHHTLYRYGWLLGASLLQGVDDALSYANTNTYLSGSGVAVVTHQLDNGQIALQALGNVGNTLAPIMAQRFDTPPTVRVRSGTAIGILFMKPVQESEEEDAQ
jgi:intracellular multiplication protein IcmE